MGEPPAADVAVLGALFAAVVRLPYAGAGGGLGICAESLSSSGSVAWLKNNGMMINPKAVSNRSPTMRFFSLVSTD